MALTASLWLNAAEDGDKTDWLDSVETAFDDGVTWPRRVGLSKIG